MQCDGKLTRSSMAEATALPFKLIRLCKLFGKKAAFSFGDVEAVDRGEIRVIWSDTGAVEALNVDELVRRQVSPCFPPTHARFSCQFPDMYATQDCSAVWDPLINSMADDG